MDPSRHRTQVAGSSAMGSTKIQPMTRPNFGRAGRHIRLETNFFKMSIPRNLRVNQYSIQILRLKRKDSDEKRRRRSRTAPRGASASAAGSSERNWIDVSALELKTFNRAVFDQVCRRHGHDFGCSLAYDGRSIAYSAREVNRRCLGTNYKVLVGSEGTPPSEDEIRMNNAEEMQVRIEHAKVLKFDDVLSERVGTIASAEYLAALDVVIATTPMGRYVQIGRSFYSPDHSEPLGRQAVTASAWRGFYQSARLSLSGLVVNLDESFTAFWNKGGRPLAELIFEANEKHELRCDNPRRLRDVAQRLKALKVRARHTKLGYRVHGFSNKGADRIFFRSSDDREVSIADYFKDTYGINLRYPHWPCVKTNLKRDTYLPIEVLIVVENQRIVGTLSQDQTQGIVKIASSRPHVRRDAAVRTMQRLNHSADPVCRDFGVKVAPGLISVEARVLPAPSIQYKRNKVRPSDGAWKAQREQFMSGGILWTWAVVSMSTLKDHEVKEFARVLARCGRRSGMTISTDQPEVFRCRPDRAADELRRVASAYNEGSRLRIKGYPLQLVVVIKERQEAPVYNAIKRVMDTELGIANQVCLQKHCGPQGRNREMYCDNVILKINAKLGGQNSVVSPYSDDGSSGIGDVPFVDRPHIVLGADVTHPMAGGRSPSVAALVGSRDRQGVQYSGAIRNQPGRQEVIVELGHMFKEVYYRWYENFGKKWHVESIIMFRDGVSDGQFEEVLQVELEALRKACRDISKNFRPSITYIIVTKRHHARFFADKRNSDRSGNILPGTVIDKDITSREFYDFYLNSHAGIQGTSKPSKYTVLIDENKIPVDTLQGYIYRLSHGFVRCNRSVSMVNSAYYAHLLAFRGRAYLGEEMLETASVGSNGSQVPRAPQLHHYLAKRLYFV